MDKVLQIYLMKCRILFYEIINTCLYHLLLCIITFCRKTSGAKEQTPRDITTICNSIQWIYLLETCRPFITGTISMATRISRLLCIFIGGMLENYSFIGTL